MARKTRRRPFRRPNTQQRTEDANDRQRRIESDARSLLANRSPEQLRVELAEREYQLAEADRIAQLDPSPQNLNRYRMAAAQHAATRAALEMSSRAS